MDTKNIFDYTYYRIAKQYFKRDGLEAITAILTLVLIKFLYLLSLYFLCKELLNFDNNPRTTSTVEKIIVLFIIHWLSLRFASPYKPKGERHISNLNK